MSCTPKLPGTSLQMMLRRREPEALAFCFRNNLDFKDVLRGKAMEDIRTGTWRDAYWWPKDVYNLSSSSENEDEETPKATAAQKPPRAESEHECKEDEEPLKVPAQTRPRADSDDECVVVEQEPKLIPTVIIDDEDPRPEKQFAVALERFRHSQHKRKHKSFPEESVPAVASSDQVPETAEKFVLMKLTPKAAAHKGKVKHGRQLRPTAKTASHQSSASSSSTLKPKPPSTPPPAWLMCKKEVC